MARFNIVPERSTVLIEASSSIHPITTRTVGLEGFVDLDVDPAGTIKVGDSAAGELSLAVSRLKSGNPLQDREMRRRIDARRFPTIDGRLTEMHETGVAGRYRVQGDITFRGVTLTYEDELAIAVADGGGLEIEGRTTFDIRDFGMEPPRILTLRVHPEVTVSIEVRAEPAV
jgi:polyisoprenoid-binding protein YceI